MGKKIRVVWLCHMMNPQIAGHITQETEGGLKILFRFLDLVKGLLPNKVKNKLLIREKSYFKREERSIWNTNALKEFEQFEDVDLHIISAVTNINKPWLCYDENGVHYNFFRDQLDYIFPFVCAQIWKLFFKTKKVLPYKINRRRIRKKIDEICPDVIHLIGHEGEFFSQVYFDIKDKYPVLIQLQTVLSSEKMMKAYPQFYARMLMEKKMFQEAQYIGTGVKEFVDFLKPKYCQVKYFNTTLALSEAVNRAEAKKIYDFVYWSIYLNKAGDLAFEAFGRAYTKHPEITLDVIGSCDDGYKQFLMGILKKYGAENAVHFEGVLETHQDVINQLRKSRFALLPLKSDYISGTVREAMANGLPVVTTITEGTPTLNNNAKCVLLSEVGDHNAMANNMLSLLENPQLASSLREKSYLLSEERITHKQVAEQYRIAYYAIADNYKSGTPIPSDLLFHEC